MLTGAIMFMTLIDDDRLDCWLMVCAADDVGTMWLLLLGDGDDCREYGPSSPVHVE